MTDKKYIIILERAVSCACQTEDKRSQQMRDDAQRQAAKVNFENKFACAFGNLRETLFGGRVAQNEEIFARYINDSAFEALVAQWLVSDVCRRLGGNPAAPPKYPLAKRPAAKAARNR